MNHQTTQIHVMLSDKRAQSKLLKLEGMMNESEAGQPPLAFFSKIPQGDETNWMSSFLVVF